MEKSSGPGGSNNGGILPGAGGGCLVRHDARADMLWPQSRVKKYLWPRSAGDEME